MKIHINLRLRKALIAAFAAAAICYTLPHSAAHAADLPNLTTANTITLNDDSAHSYDANEQKYSQSSTHTVAAETGHIEVDIIGLESIGWEPPVDPTEINLDEHGKVDLITINCSANFTGEDEYSRYQSDALITGGSTYEGDIVINVTKLKGAEGWRELDFNLGSFGSEESINLAAGKTLTVNTRGKEAINPEDPEDPFYFIGRVYIHDKLTGAGSVVLTDDGVKNDNDDLFLTGDNSYSGGTVINGGSLILMHANAAGTGDITLNGGYLYIFDDDPTATVKNNITVTSNAEITVSDRYSGTATVTQQATLIAFGSSEKATFAVGEGATLQMSHEYYPVIPENPENPEFDNKYRPDAISINEVTLNEGSTLDLFDEKGEIYWIDDTDKAAIAAELAKMEMEATVTIGKLTATGATIEGNLTDSNVTLNNSSSMEGNLTSSNVTLNDSSLKGNLTDSNVTLNNSSLKGNLTSSNVTIDNNSSLTGELILDGTLTLNDTLSPTGEIGEISSLGSLVVNEGSSLTLDNIFDYKEGSHDIISITGGITGLDKLKINGLEGITTRAQYSLSDNGGNLVLSVIGEAADLEWGENVNGNWGVGETGAEWATSSQEDKHYYDGDKVTFNGGTVTLVGDVAPSSITVTGENDTTITGAGSIVGNTGLVKKGSGTLELNTKNAYSGGTTVSDGTLSLGHINGAGTGIITLSGGALDLNAHAVANNITVNGNTSISDGGYYLGQLTMVSGTLSGDINLAKGNILTKSDDVNYDNYMRAISGTVSATLSGDGGIIKTGEVDDVLTLSGVNSYTGDTIVTGGTLSLGNVDALGASNVLLQGGTLDLAGKAVANKITVNGDTSISAGDSYLGQLAMVSGTLSGDINLAQDMIATSGTVSADLSGTGGIDKTGEGELILSGDNSYTGDTRVNGGTLSLGNVNALGKGALHVTGAGLDLTGLGGDTLNLTDVSTISGATLSIAIDAESFANTLTPQTVFSGADMTISNSSVLLTALDDDTLKALRELTDTEGVTIFELGDNVTLGGDGNLEVVVDGMLGKYIKNAEFNDKGDLIVDINTTFYEDAIVSGNGAAGMEMIKSVYESVNPQSNPSRYADLSAAMNSIDKMLVAGDHSGVNKLSAAIAGASTTALGSSMMSELERQMRSSRSRAKAAMTTASNESYSAWIAAESNFDSLGNDGTSLGHSLSSWGGSFGVDMAASEDVRMGISFTSMYGDVSTDKLDHGDGSLDTQFISLYAQAQSGKWSHNMVMSFGWGTAEMDRRVSHANGTYNTNGETDTAGWGLAYEAGYQLDKNWQVIAGAALHNSSVDSYKESGSDAALNVGKQESTWSTFGLGMALQTAAGENTINRNCMFNARAMAKLYTGDLDSSSNISLLAGGNSATVQGTEAGAFAFEMGTGVIIPVSSSNGDIFIDAALQLRSDQSSVNVSTGYRFSF